MGNLLKTVVVLSAIAGLAAGVLLLIPFLTPLVFLLMFVIFGAGIIVYLKKNVLVGILSVQDGALIGAISGFVSLTASSVVYLPIMFLFNLFFGNRMSSFGIGSSLTVISYNLFFAIILVFFVSLLSALFNAFFGMVAAYIYEKIEDRPFELHANFEVEQED